MPRRSSAQSLAIPAPVGGLNSKDPISQLDATYAQELENFFPKNGTVDLRNGYRYHSKTIGTTYIGAIGTLEYSGVAKLLAVAQSNSRLYDCTTASAAATDISGGVAFTNSDVFFYQFRDRVFMKANSNSSDVYHYTGTGNMVASAFVGPAGDDKDLLSIGSYKSRIYFTQYTTTPSIWYGAVDAVTGALTEFPLTSVLTKPFNYLYFVGSTTRAKQYAEDDLLCIITDGGEVLLYEGDNPGAANWALVGRYFIPRPLSLRSFFYAGDSLYVFTGSGTISIKSLMSGSQGGIYPSISENIDKELEALTLSGAPSATVAVYPRGRYLLLDLAPVQYVMNLQTGAWAKFSNQNATCWTPFQGRLYFGSALAARVMKADEGYFDEDPTNEGAVLSRTIKMRCSPNYFGDRSAVKQFTEAKPIIYQSEGLDLKMGINTDYSDTVATNQNLDTTDTAYKLYTPRVGLQGIGKCGSIRIDGTVTTKRISLQAVEVLWNEGDIV